MVAVGGGAAGRLHSGSRAARCDQVNHNSLCDMASVVRAAVMGPNIISSVSRDLPHWAPAVSQGICHRAEIKLRENTGPPGTSKIRGSTV